MHAICSGLACTFVCIVYHHNRSCEVPPYAQNSCVDGLQDIELLPKRTFSIKAPML